MIEYYNIQILIGLETDRSFLSCAPDGRVDLWDHDDGSGRQRWALEALGPSGPHRQAAFTISPLGGVPGADIRLQGRQDTRIVTVGSFWNDPSHPSDWILQPVPITEPDNDYHIRVVAPGGDAGAYLSCTADGTQVDLWGHDDGSGRQRWQLQGPYSTP
jgi:hypothetical protein